MQSWWNPTSPTKENVSSSVDGLAFVLEQHEAALGPEPPVVYARRDISKTVRLTGHVPPDAWCRLGTQVLPKLTKGINLRIGINISVTVEGGSAVGLAGELRQILHGLGLANSISLEG